MYFASFFAFIMKSLTQHWWLWGVKHKAVIFISTFTRFGIQNGGKYCVRKDCTRWHIAKHTANSRKKIFSKAKLHERENERTYKRELWWLRAKASVQDGVSEWARDDKNGKALDFAILKRHSEWIFFSNQSIDGFSGKIFVARCITAHSMHCSLFTVHVSRRLNIPCGKNNNSNRRIERMRMMASFCFAQRISSVILALHIFSESHALFAASLLSSTRLLSFCFISTIQL